MADRLLLAGLLGMLLGLLLLLVGLWMLRQVFLEVNPFLREANKVRCLTSQDIRKGRVGK
jgi:hypothetical protein